MKKVLYAFLAVAMALTVGSCNYEKDLDIDTNGGEGLDFVHFADASESWAIAEDDESFVYDILIGRSLPQTQAVTYDIVLGPGTTGKEGEDFKLLTKSVTIPAGETTANVKVEIPYETTGIVFKIELMLDLVDDLVNPSYGVSHMISVSTDKFPYDWDWLATKWAAEDYFYYDKTKETYSVTIEKVDETTCKISDFGVGGFPGWDIIGTVDFDKKTITFTTYVKGAHVDQYAADLYLVAVDPDNDFDVYEDLEKPIVVKFSPESLEIGPWDAFLVGGPYDGYTYAGGIMTTLSK